MDQSEVNLEQMADDWLDPYYQYEGSQEEYFDWSTDYSSQEYETTQPSTNIPWREHPEARVGTEVLEEYYTTSEKSWFDKIGDAIEKFAPSIGNIFGPKPSPSTQPQPQTKIPVYTGEQPTATPGTTVINPPAAESPGTNVILSIAGDAESALGSNWMIYIAVGLAAYYFLR